MMLSRQDNVQMQKGRSDGSRTDMPFFFFEPLFYQSGINFQEPAQHISFYVQLARSGSHSYLQINHRQRGMGWP